MKIRNFAAMTPQSLIDITHSQPLILVVVDGMHEPPLPQLGGLTPCEAAQCEHILSMKRDEICLTPRGMEASTDVALLTLLGYDAAAAGSCRAPLEAIGCGISVGANDTVVRCNLVTIRQGMIVSHCGENLSMESALNIVNLLNGHFALPNMRFYHGNGFRALLKIRGLETLPASTPPHDILNKPFLDHIISDNNLANLILKANIRLSRQNLGANGIWLWGAGRIRGFAPLGIDGCCISGTPLVRGLSKELGMNIINVDGADGTMSTNLAGKAEAAIRASAHHRLVLVHVEACDEASHRRDIEGKIKMLRRVDTELIKPLLGHARKIGATVAVLSDHATSTISGSHLPIPVPCHLS